MEELLNALVAFINETRSARVNQEEMNRAVRKISQNYCNLKKEPGFWTAMDQNFGEDVELYSLLLSAVYYVTKDEACLRKTEELSVKNDIDLFMAEGMQYQVRLNRFRNAEGSRPTYAGLRKSQHFLLCRLLSEYGIRLPFLPYAERNKRRIAIMTDALLSRKHAPTNVVLEICEILREFDYEVFLSVCISDADGAKAQAYSVLPFQAKYIADYNGDFSLDLENGKLCAFQMILERNNIDEYVKLLRRIREWKPLCVWYIGGNSIWHDACGSFITTISMPCTEGYSVSEADVLVSYMRTQGGYFEEARRYIHGCGQRIIDIQTGRVYEKKEERYNREDYGIPRSSFLIALVGNRLEDELSGEFLTLLERLAEENEQIYYAVIGAYHKTVESRLLKERMVCLGFREDLLNVLEMTDLFVNPPRKGGGGGAARAQAVGKPVVSLGHCDVAAIAGEEFCCNDLEEMKRMVRRYCMDKDFYRLMAQKAYEKYKMRSEVNMSDQYGSVIKQTEAWLESGELR